MHEWSIAESIIEAVIQSVKYQKILEVEIKIGELRDLDIEILRESLKILSSETILRDTKFDIIVSKAVFKCFDCGEEWGMREALKIMENMLTVDKYVLEENELEPPIHFIPSLVIGLQRCPKCGGMDINIESGRELEISKVKVEE
ncbi:MAG: hydrogenase/urease maturation nickel metallochaperone HypA [Aigarchaeota archaeon]|nr:hydrogenase/urease maturation nickel metallochaperone HypA [Aigarchaeota archaeon]MCX8192612.1 hydrogenase/urease maturation nickel metallochaperone HypA [Nitrososphaeria archaeon]MDW7985652.1 hydrogenase/urease maturation nickel metallochaperone HypA [Nitrososphaerota archaeon]